MKFRILTGITGITSALALCAGTASADSTVRFWYHFDNADNPMDALIEEFEEANPDINVEADNIPWNSYYDQLYTSIIGSNAPDAAMVKMFAQPRLIEMGALAPIDDWLAAWEGTADLQDNLLDLVQGPDGKQYYLPVQYVVPYLYYRPDMFAELGLEVPATCEEFRETAKALTRDLDGDGRIDVYGFGFRGAKGGHDHWASFVLGSEDISLTEGLISEEGVAGTQFVADLFQKDGVFPPSAPNDGFQEIISAFKAGKTAMTIHHIGSANGMVESLGDNVSAAPVPECGGGRWTAFGDESTAVLSNAENPEAAWKWISFLSSADHNAKFNEATGQLPTVKADSESWVLHPQRFVRATTESLPFAQMLPNTMETADFVNTVWPTAMQRVLLGDITAEEMNAEIDKLYGD